MSMHSLLKAFFTGKTTVAKIYGQLLTEMGLLSKGEVLIKNPSDFRGSVMGSSEKNTRDILRAAEGNVLVIDEAYALCTSNGLNGTSDPYGTAVIDTIVEQIQARPGDDRAVVMLGYRKEMEQMFKNVNPGLSRRFQLEYAYEFPDYDDASLLKILRKKAKDSHLHISIPVAKRAVRKLAKSRAKPNFGNGGAVDSLLSQAKETMQKRDGTSNELTKEDFAIEDDGFDEAELDSLFKDMIGMDNVINKLEDLKRIVKFAKARGENPSDSVSFNFLFLGNPGTGKTSIARCMGRMFNILGLLPDDKVVECTPKDFTSGFAGQAGIKTTEILEQSRGGVLFIDEAYQLNPKRGGPYMTEVVDELCAKLTDVEFKGKILVLLAGYDADMDEMLAINPGLKSRFAERIAFKDLSEDATRDLIVLNLAKKKNIPLVTEDAKSEELLALARTLVNSKDFANGRDVDTVCDRTYAELAKRSGSNPRNTAVSLDDVRKAIDSLIISRKPHKDSRSCINIDLKDQACSKSTSTKATPVTALALEEKIDVEEEEEEEESTLEEENITEEDENHFSNLNTNHMKGLQDVVEEMGLNTLEGIEKLISSNGHDNDLIQRLMEYLDISMDVAQKFIDEWRKAHKEANRQKMKMKYKFKGMEAIWHCAVCGRGGHTSPVCYVAPYISSYRAVPL
jgi:SpoVK/Ycf46/Vps4 family AAA+-type ATPase